MSIISVLILIVTAFVTWFILKKTWEAFKVEPLESKADELSLLDKQHKLVVETSKKHKNIEQKRKQVNTFKTKGAKK